jgi:hypothetical protein
MPVVYSLSVTRSQTAPLVKLLTHLRDLADDLARGLPRSGQGDSITARAMADAIKENADSVHRALNRSRR